MKFKYEIIIFIFFIYPFSSYIGTIKVTDDQTKRKTTFEVTITEVRENSKLKTEKEIKLVKNDNDSKLIEKAQKETSSRINNPQLPFKKDNNRIIDLKQMAEMINLTNNCQESSCQWCDINQLSICKQCKRGWLLYSDKCFTTCPKDSIADVFHRKCDPLDNINIFSQMSYLKSFSTGSCKNLCGKKSLDCSCLPSCTSEGTCCSDYQICESAIIKNTNRYAECFSGNPKCDLCDNFEKIPDPSDPAKLLPYKCFKCREGLYLREGVCLQNCQGTDKLMALNKVCIPKRDCFVDNCFQCSEGEEKICRTCENGYFMYKNQCLLECPYRTRADRISWTCLEPPVFAWYWTSPSKSSCRDRCGRKVDKYQDCSCMENCFQLGNCCQDIEDYCPKFVYWN
jgi:hypothetical protein